MILGFCENKGLISVQKLFIWQKQGGTDCFKGSALEGKATRDRNPCRSPHFKSRLIFLSLSQKHFDVLILETFLLTAQIAHSFQQASNGGAARGCKGRVTREGCSVLRVRGNKLTRCTAKKEEHCSASGMERVGIIFLLKIVHVWRQFDKTGSAKRIMAEVIILSTDKKPPNIGGLA